MPLLHYRDRICSRSQGHGLHVFSGCCAQEPNVFFSVHVLCFTHSAATMSSKKYILSLLMICFTCSPAAAIVVLSAIKCFQFAQIIGCDINIGLFLGSDDCVSPHYVFHG